MHFASLALSEALQLELKILHQDFATAIVDCPGPVSSEPRTFYIIAMALGTDSKFVIISRHRKLKATQAKHIEQCVYFHFGNESKCCKNRAAYK